MYKFFPKKSPKHKETIQENQASQASEHFLPMLLSSFVFCGLLLATAQPAPQVGDFLNFDGNVPPAWAGYSVVNATIVHNIWGAGSQACHINLKTMVLAKGATEIEAVSPTQVILQWHADQGTPAIGCPHAPAFFAVRVKDYQHMVAWKQAAIRPYFRG